MKKRVKKIICYTLGIIVLMIGTDITLALFNMGPVFTTGNLQKETWSTNYMTKQYGLGYTVKVYYGGAWGARKFTTVEFWFQ